VDGRDGRRLELVVDRIKSALGVVSPNKVDVEDVDWLLQHNAAALARVANPFWGVISDGNVERLCSGCVRHRHFQMLLQGQGFSRESTECDRT
jgi:hypothetical protein